MYRQSSFLIAILLGLMGSALSHAGGPVFVDLSAGARDARITGSNPAGMTRLDEEAWRTGLIVSYSESTWEATSSGLGVTTETESDSTLWIPSLFYVRPLNDRWTAGVSMSATGGLGDDGGEDSVTRYLSEEWSLGAFTLQPSVAYQLNDQWSLGAGIGLNYIIYSWEAAVFNGIGEEDGQVEVEPDDLSVNYILSAHWAPTARTRFGLSWRSEYEPNMEDTPDYSNVDPDRQSPGDLELNVTFPQSVLGGVYHEFANSHWLSLDVLWIEASEFNIETAVVEEDGGITVNPYNLEDTWVATLGWGMDLDPRWSVGLGLIYVDDPVDEDNRNVLLRVDSLWGLGASVEYTRDSGMAIGANLSWLDTGDAPVSTPVLPIIGAIEGEFTDRTNLLMEVYVSW